MAAAKVSCLKMNTGECLAYVGSVIPLCSTVARPGAELGFGITAASYGSGGGGSVGGGGRSGGDDSQLVRGCVGRSGRVSLSLSLSPL